MKKYIWVYCSNDDYNVFKNALIIAPNLVSLQDLSLFSNKNIKDLSLKLIHNTHFGSIRIDACFKKLSFCENSANILTQICSKVMNLQKN